jgi:DNA-binding transcriptional MocR family regulator
MRAEQVWNAPGTDLGATSPPLSTLNCPKMTGPFIFKAAGRLVDFMRQADEPGLINLAAGVPGLEALPAEALRHAFERAFERDPASIFAYHHPEGDHALRDLLAEGLRRRDATVGGKKLITTTGCTQALQLMLSVLVKPGDVVACEAPAYYGMLELLSEAGARVLPIPLCGADGIDLAAAQELLTRWKPRCIVVCTSLSNPSGATVPEKHRETLVELCRRLGVRIIEDDIYAELVDGGAPKPMLAFDDGSTVSYVSSFSKSVSPGLRVGVCAPGNLFEEVAARKCQQDLHSAVVTEAALREFLAAGGMEPHVKWLRSRNAHRRSVALDAIGRSFPEGTRVSLPRGGYMLWAELPRPIDFAHAADEARKQRVVFAAGDVFFAAKSAASCVRINCAKATEKDLVAGLEILGHVLCRAD